MDTDQLLEDIRKMLADNGAEWKVYDHYGERLPGEDPEQDDTGFAVVFRPVRQGDEEATQVG